MHIIIRITFIALLFSLNSCNDTPGLNNNLKLIPPTGIVKRVVDKKFNYLYATFKNQDGSELSEAQKVLLNRGKLGKDYYEDATGMIKEIRVRPITITDKFIEIQIRELSSDPLKGIRMIDVDCTKLNKGYSDAYYADQEVRTSGGNVAAVDKKNQQFVLSAIKKCGWTEDYLQAIWLIIQHSNSGVQAYCYSRLKEFAKKGALKLSNLAMLEDRMLLRHGYKQIYGTQVIDGGLQPLENPDQVNERRSTMGMGPIEEYLEYFELDFEAEKSRMLQVKT